MMNQTQILSLLAIRRLHSRSVAPTISWNTSDDAVEFGGSDTPLLGTEDRQGLGRSLGRAVERAWLTIELVLCRDMIAPKLAMPSQHMLAALVGNRCFEYLSATPAPFRHAIWRELHAARESGPLIQGEVDVDDLTGELGQTSMPIDGDQMLEAEWQALFQLADDLARKGGGRLRSLLEARFENNESLIVGLVLAFLPYELEAEGAHFSDYERGVIPSEQILWLTEQSEPLEELLNHLTHRASQPSLTLPALEIRHDDAEPVDVAARIRQGQSYSQRGDYERAAVEFTAALHTDNPRPIVHVYRGDAYRLRGDYDRALADYAAALRLDPANLLAFLNRGMVQRLLGRPEAAIVDYSETLRLDPNNVIAYNGRGAAYADLGQFDKAVADHTHALRLDPALAWAHQSRGDAYAGLGAYDLAIADYSHALRLNPHLPLAFTNRGDAYRLKSDFDRSIADYTEALRLDPLNPRVFTNRGESYRRKGELDRALADFGEAIRVDPTNPAVYLSRGIAYQLAGEHDRAVADFDRAEQFDSANPEVFYQRALTYKKEGAYDRAMADLGKAIELNPRDVAAFLSRGSLRAIITNFDGAIADFSEAIRLDPASAQARLERGRIQAQRGQFDAALADCAEALRLDPQLVPAYLVRGGSLLRTGEFDRAIGEFNEAIRINPRYAKAYNDRGVAYSKLERLDEAIADFSHALQFAPEYVQALANRGNAYQIQKQHDRALRDFTQAVQLDVKYAAAYCVQRGVVEAARRHFSQAIADYTVALVLDPNNAAASKGIKEVKKLRESDFEIAEGPVPETTPAEAPRAKAPRPTETQIVPAVRESKAADTQHAMPAVKTDYEIDLTQYAPAGKQSTASEEAVAEVDFEIVDNETEATAEPDRNAATHKSVVVEPAKPAPTADKFGEFPEHLTIQQRIAKVKEMEALAQRRFEENKLKAEKAEKAKKSRPGKEDPEERAERRKRYKQYAIIVLGAIFIGYWGVQLVSALIPPPVNPFKEVAADKFLGDYAKDKVAADGQYAEKFIALRGKVMVVPDTKRMNPDPPRVFFDAVGSKEDIRVECKFQDADMHWTIKDGEEYRITGKVQRFKPGTGILLLEANVVPAGKAKGQADSPGQWLASEAWRSANQLEPLKSRLSRKMPAKLHQNHSRDHYNPPASFKTTSRGDDASTPQIGATVCPTTCFVFERNSHA